MNKLVTVSEMRAIERAADASGLSYAQMMENAGLNLALAVKAAYSHTFKSQPLALGLVGAGNNGGDTLVALDHLSAWGWETAALILRPRPEGDPLITRLLERGGEVIFLETASPQEIVSALEKQCAGRAVILLDGLLGTGFRLPLKPDLAAVMGAVRDFIRVSTDKSLFYRRDRRERGELLIKNSAISAHSAVNLDVPSDHPFPRLHVVAVDCPSGVDCDSGEAAAECLPAERTVTMAAVKQGLLRFPAYPLVGALEVAGIGDLSALGAWQTVHRFVADADFVRGVLPARPLDAHKGSFGTALVVAGSTSYSGAALLAAEAAYRIGAGLVTLAAPEPLHAALAGHLPEATWVLLPHERGFIAESAGEIVRASLLRATALLVGPGFGLEDTTKRFIHNLFTQGFPSGLPLVLDADGLKLAASLADWHKRLPANSVLTPHPGEMSVLAGLSKDEIQTRRLEIAEKYAQQWGHVVVLKGAFTVIAAPTGETALIPVATPALARAGSGDVLAGLIVGLRAQGVAAFQAAVAGAWIHAQAGLLAAQEVGGTASVLAEDVLGAVIRVLADVVNGSTASLSL